MIALDYRNSASSSFNDPGSIGGMPKALSAVSPSLLRESGRRRDVATTFSYFKPVSNEAPYQYIKEPPPGVPRHNLLHDIQHSIVRDIRGSEKMASLDVTGFEYVRHSSAEKEFLDEEVVKTVYYKEIEDMLKKQTGAKRVVVLEHTIRRKYDGKQGLHTNAPVHRVHVDQTFEAAVTRVHRHLGDEAPRLLKSRVRLINVWRPISHPVAHTPLAVLDARTFDPAGLVSIRFIFPDREGSVYSLRHEKRHEWYYLSDQTPEEVVMFKCYDSLDDGRTARCCPHSAFTDSSSPAHAPARESIEVRALVFDDE